MIRINLLPASVRKTKGVQRLYAYGIIAASLLGILLVLLLLQMAGQIRRVDTRITQIEAAGAKLADRIAYLRALTAREAAAERLRQLIRERRPGQAVWIRILDELADLIRDDLWLTQLLSEPATETTPLTLTLDGQAYTKVSVADFMTALENADHFGDVHLLALTDRPEQDRTQVQFRLRVHYRGEAPAPGRTAP